MHTSNMLAHVSMQGKSLNKMMHYDEALDYCKKQLSIYQDKFRLNHAKVVNLFRNIDVVWENKINYGHPTKIFEKLFVNYIKLISTVYQAHLLNAVKWIAWLRKKLLLSPDSIAKIKYYSNARM